MLYGTGGSAFALLLWGSALATDVAHGPGPGGPCPRKVEYAHRLHTVYTYLRLAVRLIDTAQWHQDANPRIGEGLRYHFVSDPTRKYGCEIEEYSMFGSGNTLVPTGSFRDDD